MNTDSDIHALQALSLDYQQKLQQHPLYQELQELPQIRIFMEHHVFAVWDFMSLLKALQQRLTCTRIPWQPTARPLSRRLINEIVLEEESDLSFDGRYLSHFELYCEAMQTCDAKLSGIQALLQNLQAGKEVPQALCHPQVPPAAADFVNLTWQILQGNSTAAIAAAFTLGRETVIPSMFRQVIERLQQQHGNLAPLIYYLERHIDLDEAEHTPLAWQMLEEICQHEKQGWVRARHAAEQALKARLKLWDAILVQATALTPVAAQ